MYFARMKNMIANAINSTKNVPLGTRKLLSSGIICGSII
jgi:hypothetical protein